MESSGPRNGISLSQEDSQRKSPSHRAHLGARALTRFRKFGHLDPRPLIMAIQTAGKTACPNLLDQSFGERWGRRFRRRFRLPAETDFHRSSKIPKNV